MNLMKTSILFLAGISVFATLAIAEGRSDGRSRGRPHDVESVERDGARSEHRGESRRARVANARRFLREMRFSDAQRALARDEAAAIAQKVRAGRSELRAIRDAARARARGGDAEGARKEARAQRAALRERLGRELAPHGRIFLQSLTPEQRARIEERLAARGKTFDVDRASERVGRWLARPRVQDRMREHVRTGPRTGR